MPIIAIYNPVCGDGTAQSFFADHVLPLLSKHDKNVDKCVPTMYKGHAGQIILDFVEEQFIGQVEADITVILGSGDGTLHEIINHLSSVVDKRLDPFPKLHFAIVPCGTANALFSSLFMSQNDGGASITPAYKLQSINSYIHASSVVPLNLAIATLSSNPSNGRESLQVTASAVVTSTSLHAAILNDSESLRSEIPGIERFKIAASNNSTKWYSSFVKLLPMPSTGMVQIYNPATNTFVRHADSDKQDPIVRLDGPFVYFLSTVNVDRLETAFRITPLARTIPSSEASCEVLILRPLRDPSIREVHAQAREAFVPKLWHVLQNAYNDGQHINLRYDGDGNIVSDGDGPAVLEYFRCGGWEWIPDEKDKDAHLLCSDGTIFNIEKGGQVICSAVGPDSTTGFVVYG